MPPPAAPQAAKASRTAALSTVWPSPTAPKSVTSKIDVPEGEGDNDDGPGAVDKSAARSSLRRTMEWGANMIVLKKDAR